MYVCVLHFGGMTVYCILVGPDVYLEQPGIYWWEYGISREKTIREIRSFVERVARMLKESLKVKIKSPERGERDALVQSSWGASEKNLRQIKLFGLWELIGLWEKYQVERCLCRTSWRICRVGIWSWVFEKAGSGFEYLSLWKRVIWQVKQSAVAILYPKWYRQPFRLSRANWGSRTHKPNNIVVTCGTFAKAIQSLHAMPLFVRKRFTEVRLTECSDSFRITRWEKIELLCMTLCKMDAP